uniref:preprotein translocase subunit YajC n=1 Tax=Weissella soli TaxID=155866 RepID=UPI0035A17C1B
MSQILIIVIFIAAMYFMMIRPQQKQAKQRQQMLAQIQKGTKVVTIGGLHGIVDSLDEKIVVLDVEGVYLMFDR